MSPAAQIATILGLGVGAQWIASRLRLPSILLLLTSGIVAGQLDWIDPDVLFEGNDGLLQAVVSLSVAVILFEGGLTLQWSELRRVGAVVGKLVTVGVLLTWVLGGLAAWWLLDVDAAVASLIGAVLVLSGPTVVAPLLRHLRPEGETGPILKWEGIVIDPVGALLAALVYHSILSGHGVDSAGDLAGVAWEVIKTIFVGGVGAAIAAGALLFLLRQHWVPDVMQAPLTLGATLVCFVICDHLQHESGLLAAVGMGFVFANQRVVPVHHISVFKEHLTMLLIPSLFVLLASRLSLAELQAQAFSGGLLFLAVLLIVVRPVSVWLSTLGSGLRGKDRLFLAWMFPRGIVAAAVAPFFALGLAGRDLEGVEALVPVTYLVVIGTVAIYGLTAGPLARLLGITRPSPQGLVLVGAGELAQAVAATLEQSGFTTVLTDTNRQHVARARLEGRRAEHINVVAEDSLEDIDLGGIGRLLALTPNDEVNTLATLQGREVFGRVGVYQVAPEAKAHVGHEHPLHIRGRIAFGEELTYAKLSGLLRRGYVVKKTNMSEDFGVEEFRDLYGEQAVPLFRVTADGQLQVLQGDEELRVEPGDGLISLVEPQPRTEEGAEGREA